MVGRTVPRLMRKDIGNSRYAYAITDGFTLPPEGEHLETFYRKKAKSDEYLCAETLAGGFGDSYANNVLYFLVID